jgi:hypothetical protein
MTCSQKIFFGAAVAFGLAGAGTDVATGGRWAAGPLSRDEMFRVRGGNGSCYVENNSPCVFAEGIGECGGPAPGPGGPCTPPVGWYQVIETIYRTNTDDVGLTAKFTGEPVWCYNKHQCTAEMQNGMWTCVKGAYVDHSAQYDEEFPTGSACTSE